jgi:hypothetical protein
LFVSGNEPSKVGNPEDGLPPHKFELAGGERPKNKELGGGKEGRREGERMGFV